MRPQLPRLSALAAVVVVTAAASHADPRSTDDTFAVRPAGELILDGALVTGFPAALPTGLVRGVGLGITRGTTYAWGARASWATASESSMAWDVTHREVRARVTGSIQHAAGRGTLALRLGLGGTLIHEGRRRHQGARAGLMGDELETSAWAVLPVATLEAVVALRIKGPWAMVVSGGPALHLDGDRANAGWCAELGVAWQP